MLGTIGIDDPKVRDAAVRSDVLGLARVHNALAVRRNLRIGGHLNAEHVHGLQPVGNVLSPAEERRKQDEDDEGSEAAEFLRHGSFLSRMNRGRNF